MRSVSLSGDGGRALVGTLGCDLLEMTTIALPKIANDEQEDAEVAVDEGAGAADPAFRASAPAVGRVLNGGVPVACGHCQGQLRAMDVSSQGVSPVNSSSRHVPCKLPSDYVAQDALEYCR